MFLVVLFVVVVDLIRSIRTTLDASVTRASSIGPISHYRYFGIGSN